MGVSLEYQSHLYSMNGQPYFQPPSMSRILHLRRERYELLSTLKQVMETCPCDPDTTDDFLAASKVAAALIQKLEHGKES